MKHLKIWIMKRKWILLFSCIVLLWSCQESMLDPIDNKIDPVVKKTITIIASATKGGVIDPSGETNLIVGQTKIYKATPEFGYITQKITLNGVEQSFVDNSISITAKEDSKNSNELKVEFIEKNIVLLSQEPWYFLLEEVRHENGNDTWNATHVTEGKRLDFIIVFGKDKMYRGYFEDGAMCSGPYGWSLVGNELSFGGENFSLIELSDKKLIFQALKSGLFTRFTYYRK